MIKEKRTSIFILFTALDSGRSRLEREGGSTTHCSSSTLSFLQWQGKKSRGGSNGVSGGRGLEPPSPPAGSAPGKHHSSWYTYCSWQNAIFSTAHLYIIEVSFTALVWVGGAIYNLTAFTQTSINGDQYSILVLVPSSMNMVMLSLHLVEISSVCGNDGFLNYWLKIYRCPFEAAREYNWECNEPGIVCAKIFSDF